MLTQKIDDQCYYHRVERDSVERFRHGDEVRIAGEPGLRLYKVVGTDTARGIVTISDRLGTFRVPESSLRRA